MQVELIDHMGSDLTVVNSARVSMDKQHTVFEGLADGKLLEYLANNGHWTPFSHPMITLRETVPIFLARQRFKHMIGFTYNEVSRRYVDSPPDFYMPNEWRERPDGSIKQGSGGKHKLSDVISEDYEDLIDACNSLYTTLIKAKVAPEQARIVLPQSMMTSYYVTGSLYAFARAYNQRIDNHAQEEIQLVASQWDTLIQPLFPRSWEALTSGETK